MKTTTMTWPVLALAILSNAAFAADQVGTATSTTQTKAAPARAATKRAVSASISKFSGTAQSVNTFMNKLSVKNKKGEVREFTVGTDVKITKGGESITLSEIAAGDTVTVSYEGAASAPSIKGIMVAKAHQAHHKS